MRSTAVRSGLWLACLVALATAGPRERQTS